MYGAIVGDVVGSRHEFRPIKTKEFDLLHEGCFFTDDSVLTIAVADAIAYDTDMAASLRRYTLDNVTSYGPHYWDWANGRLGAGPYGSWANGAAMRVSAAAWFAHDIDECLLLAERSAKATHDHPEGVRGARAVAAAIFAGMSGWDARSIRDFVKKLSGYDLSQSVDDIRPKAEFELKSWVSVPRAIICALDATDFEDAVRNAVSLGGDADTEAAIAGSIAEVMFGIPEKIRTAALDRLPPHLREDAIHLREMAEARLRASPRDPLHPDDIGYLPRWNPACVREWNEARTPKTTPVSIDDVIVEDWVPWQMPTALDKGSLGGAFLSRLASILGITRKR